LTSAWEFFGEGSVDWYLQEDNDPKHRSKTAKKWKAENHVKVLLWPAYSPDQNLIENVWRLLKIKIQKKKIRSVTGLRREIAKEWKKFSDTLAENLVKSMSDRVLTLIESDGDYTMY
jgi:hypothetical protein